MRKLALLFLLAGMASPAVAADRATVDQLEQWLATVQGKPDATVAKRLGTLEMSERVSSIRLARWEAEFPGAHERLALVALADASAFLDLPARELPARLPPDIKAQSAILTQAIDYVAKTMPKLPNFVARRDTTYFEDMPAQGGALALQSASIGGRGGSRINITAAPSETEAQPLSFVGASSVTVTYRDGREVQVTAKGGKAAVPARGLTTGGEFGPILGLVLGDAVRGSVTWSHWEQGTEAVEAVFRYTVPQEKSHYMVGVPFLSKAPLFPAYHGQIAVDSADGSVLRMTVVSDLKAPYEGVVANMLVEYGPMTIGARTYICPLKGVAISKVPLAGLRDAIRTQVNDVLFIQYQVFRGEARILDPNDMAAAP